MEGKAMKVYVVALILCFFKAVSAELVQVLWNKVTYAQPGCQGSLQEKRAEGAFILDQCHLLQSGLSSTISFNGSHTYTETFQNANCTGQGEIFIEALGTDPCTGNYLLETVESTQAVVSFIAVFDNVPLSDEAACTAIGTKYRADLPQAMQAGQFEVAEVGGEAAGFCFGLSQLSFQVFQNSSVMSYQQPGCKGESLETDCFSIDFSEYFVLTTIHNYLGLGTSTPDTPAPVFEGIESNDTIRVVWDKIKYANSSCEVLISKRSEEAFALDRCTVIGNHLSVLATLEGGLIKSSTFTNPTCSGVADVERSSVVNTTCDGTSRPVLLEHANVNENLVLFIASLEAGATISVEEVCESFPTKDSSQLVELAEAVGVGIQEVGAVGKGTQCKNFATKSFRPASDGKMQVFSQTECRGNSSLSNCVAFKDSQDIDVALVSMSFARFFNLTWRIGEDDDSSGDDGDDDDIGGDDDDIGDDDDDMGDDDDDGDDNDGDDGSGEGEEVGSTRSPSSATIKLRCLSLFSLLVPVLIH